jgi:hypothetical protein
MSPMSQTSLARAPRSDPPARDTPPLTNTGTSIHLPSPAHGSPSSTTVVEKFRRATNVPPTVAPLLLRPRAIPLALTVWHTRVRTANLRPLQESLKVAPMTTGDRRGAPSPAPSNSRAIDSVRVGHQRFRGDETNKLLRSSGVRKHRQTFKRAFELFRCQEQRARQDHSVSSVPNFGGLRL